jgi:hypothetical protein
MKRICIVGSGAAGILMLLSLQKAKVSPKQVIVIDPFHDGGDLRRKWSSVRSNTLWKQILEAVPCSELPEPYKSLDPESPCELRFVIQYLLDQVKDYRNQCEIHSTVVQSIQQVESKQWSLTVKNKPTPILCDTLILTTGSEPKSLDLPFPCIPLDVGLDSTRLYSYVKPGQTVLLFGTAHSGAVLVENLVKCGATVVNFYATPKPFYFDRDGDYDGVKQDAARIADTILSGGYGSQVSLVSISDLGGVIRHTRTADAVIYAIGFEGRNSFGFKGYDGETGKIQDVENAWGFGIAYPNKAADGIHWDVSVPAFMNHIQKQMPSILSSLGIE